MKKLLTLITCAFILAGCSSNKLSAYKANDFEDKMATLTEWTHDDPQTSISEFFEEAGCYTVNYVVGNNFVDGLNAYANGQGGGLIHYESYMNDISAADLKDFQLKLKAEGYTIEEYDNSFSAVQGEMYQYITSEYSCNFMLSKDYIQVLDTFKFPN